jgi:hypothetical protein
MHGGSVSQIISVKSALSCQVRANSDLHSIVLTDFRRRYEAISLAVLFDLKGGSG